MATFSKCAQSAAVLLAKLEAQGLIVHDHKLAFQYLNYVGHYRLKGYWYHLIDPHTKQFRAGTTFEMLRDRYELDREIRALLLDAVERLEVAVRGSICDYLSLKYSPHWYLDAHLFKPVREFGIGQMLSKIEGEVGRSRDKHFIDAYFRKYDDPYLPPSWGMSECVTLGMWSRTFKILRDPADKKAIAAKFGIVQVEVFESWLHTMAVLRNMAAHHDRFLKRKLSVAPSNHKAIGLKFADNQSVYAGLTVIHVLLEAIGFSAVLRQRLVDLQKTYGAGLMQELGFPQHWPQGAVGW